jgi:CBS domain containing-hemolysin-like protein
MILNIFITLLLVAANGFFVAAEFAIIKVRASQLELKVRAGHKLGKLAQSIHEHLDAYLSATQLGITFTSLGLGWVGESVVAELILDIMHKLHLSLSPELAHHIALPIAFVFITILHIVVGELAPKSVAIRYPLATTMAVAGPLRAFYFIFSPFIWLLNESANALIRGLGLKRSSHHEGASHSPEELRLLLEQGKDEGVIKSAEHDIINNVFFSTKKTVKQIMVPRTNIEALSISSSKEEALAKFSDEGYSRLPVYRESLDNIVGILYAKDLLKGFGQKQNGDYNWKEKIGKAYFVPETKSMMSLLREFQSKRFHMAIVVDEFGSSSGLVTIEDVIEELLGDIQDEFDSEAPLIERINKNEWRVNGLATISDLNHHLPNPLPETGDYDTISGLLNLKFGRIPRISDRITAFGYDFFVIKASKRRVDLIKIMFITQEKGE